MSTIERPERLKRAQTLTAGIDGELAKRQAPKTVLEQMRKSALADLKAVAPYDPGHPCEVRVELATPDHAEQFRHHPKVEIVDPRTIVSRASDWWTAWRQFYFSYRWPD